MSDVARGIVMVRVLLVLLIGVIPSMMVWFGVSSCVRDTARGDPRPSRITTGELADFEGERWVVLEDAQWSCARRAWNRRGSHFRLAVPGPNAVWASFDGDRCEIRGSPVTGYLRSDFIPDDVLSAERELSRPGERVLVLCADCTPASEADRRWTYGLAGVSSLVVGGAVLVWARKTRVL